MKKLVLIFTIINYQLSIIKCSAQVVNIPDNTFKNYLVGLTSLNTNGNSEIEVSEAASFAGHIDVPGLGISDMTGIEAFTSLTWLRCSNNTFTMLDLSANTELTYVNCYYDLQLSSINVSTCTSLRYLELGSTNINNLDVTNNTLLHYLSCSGTYSVLDVSNNTLLDTLDCTNSSLTYLDVSVNTALKYLRVANTQLNSIDISNNTSLRIFDCSQNNFSALDVSNNLQLKSLYCLNNNLTSLDLSANTALISLDCSHNQLTNINVSSCSNLSTFFCNNNQVVTTNISNNLNITNLRCNNNLLASLDVSPMHQLSQLNASYNQLSYLDVSANSQLRSLDCSSNELTVLNVKNGHNNQFWGPNAFNAQNNPNLTCIQVDFPSWAETNWTLIDDTASFSDDCHIGIEEKQSFDSNIIIYPNPAQNSITINTKPPTIGFVIKNVQLKITNTQGQEVCSSSVINYPFSIDISNLSTGIYYLNLQSNDGVGVKKFEVLR